ncbi:MAG: DNA-binding protein [Candidatus Woesearchaeota archaeon]
MQNNEFQEKMKLQQQIEQIERNAKLYLNDRALQRFGNIKAAHPEKAIQIAVMIFQAAQAGQIKNPLTDEEFKNILINLQEPKKEFKIMRK